MVVVRYPNGMLEDVPAAEAQRLLDAGLVDLAGPLPRETATVAPIERAVIPAAAPRKRGRPRKVVSGG